MTGWAAKRFWKAARAEAAAGGFAVRLDDRPLRTPAKAALVVPTRAMAEAIAAEWDAQEGRVDPRTMPVTRSANAAIDKVATQREEVVELVAAYGGSDLLCYRAAGPQALAARQAAAWDPMLRWAAEALAAPLSVTVGVVPVAQPEPSLAAFRARVAALTEFELAALHDLVGLSGSLVLGLAAAAELAGPEEIWALSRIDEAWQAEQWGEDAEAEAVAARKLADFLHAHRFWRLAHAV